MATLTERADNRAISELRELFRGRFTEEEMKTLYHLNDSDKQLTVRHIFSSDPKDIRRITETGKLKWETVETKRTQLPRESLETIRQGTIKTTCWLFACQPCDRSWWRNVPTRKKVSKCFKCKTKYDPVPREKEWGWAEFKCVCGNTFGGYCEMGVASPCYECEKDVYPGNILPPNKNRHRKRSRQTHSCSGCRGHGGTTHVHRGGVYISGGVHFSDSEPNRQCAHPSTRHRNNLPNVLTPSLVHESTGSTVATFLPQEDLDMKMYEVYDQISYLGSIEEESPTDLSDDDVCDDDGDGHNSNGDGGANNQVEVCRKEKKNKK